jgi:hypothetical protein
VDVMPRQMRNRGKHTINLKLLISGLHEGSLQCLQTLGAFLNMPRYSSTIARQSRHPLREWAASENLLSEIEGKGDAGLAFASPP